MLSGNLVGKGCRCFLVFLFGKYDTPIFTGFKNKEPFIAPNNTPYITKNNQKFLAKLQKKVFRTRIIVIIEVALRLPRIFEI